MNIKLLINYYYFYGCLLFMYVYEFCFFPDLLLCFTVFVCICIVGLRVGVMLVFKTWFVGWFVLICFGLVLGLDCDC